MIWYYMYIYVIYIYIYIYYPIQQTAKQLPQRKTTPLGLAPPRTQRWCPRRRADLPRTWNRFSSLADHFVLHRRCCWISVAVFSMAFSMVFTSICWWFHVFFHINQQASVDGNTSLTSLRTLSRAIGDGQFRSRKTRRPHGPGLHIVLLHLVLRSSIEVPRLRDGKVWRSVGSPQWGDVETWKHLHWEALSSNWICEIMWIEYVWICFLDPTKSSRSQASCMTIRLSLLWGKPCKQGWNYQGKGGLAQVVVDGKHQWKCCLVCVYHIIICLYSVQPAPELPYSHTIIRDEIGKMNENERTRIKHQCKRNCNRKMKANPSSWVTFAEAVGSCFMWIPPAVGSCRVSCLPPEKSQKWIPTKSVDAALSRQLFMVVSCRFDQGQPKRPTKQALEILGTWKSQS